MTPQSIAPQNVFIFDCDGVLMDSNGIKEEAFASVTIKYFGDEAAAEIRAYHRKNGGLSRQRKFEHIMSNFQPNVETSIASLSEEFERESSELILKCPLAENLEELLTELKTLQATLIVLSGTPEQPLKTALKRRNLSHYFDLILGSPTLKPDHLKALCDQQIIDRSTPFVFVGDSQTDLDAAKNFPNCRFFWSLEFGSRAILPVEIQTVETLYSAVKTSL